MSAGESSGNEHEHVLAGEVLHRGDPLWFAPEYNMTDPHEREALMADHERYQAGLQARANIVARGERRTGTWRLLGEVWTGGISAAGLAVGIDQLVNDRINDVQGILPTVLGVLGGLAIWHDRRKQQKQD